MTGMERLELRRIKQDMILTYEINFGLVGIKDRSWHKRP